jgi:hypothetical protein
MNRERGPDHVNAEAGLEDITCQAQMMGKIGTLSFPVCNGAPVHTNTRRIEEIVRCRSPALLLCAGWSVPSTKDLEPIKTVTKQVETVVLLEAPDGTGESINFRVCGGEQFPMAKQCFSESKNATAANLCSLDAALPSRSFKFLDRQAILLVCGEITIMCGRPPDVGFRPGVPDNLKDKVRAPGVMILNPTHTRMGEAWVVNAWRKYLSSNGNTYVSASNWDLDRQRRPSPTLHTVWHNGQEQDPVDKGTFENEFLCYREWDLPKL